MESAERQFWIEFIELYKSKPVLWKVNDPIYRDRLLKKKAYRDLIKKLDTVSDGADIDIVKRKINSMRSTYRRELKKTRENGSYKSSWWLFNHLTFLQSIEDGNGSNSKPEATAKDNNEFDYEENDETMNDTVEDKYENKHFSVLNCDEDNTVHEFGDDGATNEVYMEENEIDQKIFEAPKRKKPRFNFANLNHKDCIEMECVQLNDDESDMLARYWASQYRELSTDQKRFAKKAIDDILFEAKTGGLHKNSVKINQNSCVHNHFHCNTS